MSTIEIRHLTFAYEGSFHEVFRDLDLELDTGWRLGLIAPNGRGKTTLLRLIAGQLPGGDMIRVPVECRYFPAPVPSPERMTLEILEEAAPGAREWEILRETGKLGLDAEMMYRSFSTLSGGEQTRALLAALFLGEGSFPLIDEPTNHLDEAGRALTAKYLKGQRGFLLVSHDRAFLDGCVDHVLSLEKTGARLQAGNYSTWEEGWEGRNAWEQARNRELKREIGKLKDSARQAAQWSGKKEKEKQTGNGGAPLGMKDSGFIGARAARMMKRVKNIERRRLAAAEEKEGLLRNLEEDAPLKLRPLPFQGGRLVELKGAAPMYGGRAVCAPVTLSLAPGERVALTGPNGCGKSSVLRLLMGEELAHTGEVLVPRRLTVSWVPQSAAGLRGSLEEAEAAWRVDGALLRAILRKLGFQRGQFEKDMGEWSEGQKKKALLARSLCDSAHLYVWDEPLNYVDMFSRRRIEDLLLEYRPTLLFVEHDRRFREKIATRTVEITGTAGN